MKRVLATLLLAGSAAAEPTHFSVGGGGLVEVTEPQIGAWGAFDLWPGGGKWGVRGDAQWLRSQESLLVVGSIARELGATRPRLAVSLVAGAGADVLRPAAVVGGGLWVQFGPRLGPIAILGGVTSQLVFGEDRFELRLVGALGLGLGR